MTRIAATVFATTNSPVGNGAFASDGRLVVSHHPMYGTPHRVSSFERDGSLRPFPNAAWNTPGDDPMAYLDAVLGLRNDSEGRIWLADMGTRSRIQPKIVVWDTVADTLWRIIPIPPEVATPYSEPNDFVIDEVRGKLYIADEGAGGGGDGSRAALIVIDIESGAADRRLEGYDGIMAERRPLVIDGLPVERNGDDGVRTPIYVGVDGIVLDAAGEWLYLSPLNGHKLWRLPVAALLDPHLDDASLATRMEIYADKPNSGGICMDSDDNVYLTVIETSAVGRISAKDRSYDEPVKREDMFWPDGLMRGPDGALYVVCSQLPRSPALARPGDSPELPFKIFRFDPKSGANDVVAPIAAGAVAGAVAALAVTLFQTVSARTGPASDPGEESSPTEEVADLIAKLITGAPLGSEQRRRGGELVHIATGVGLGTVYGMLGQTWPAVRTGKGLVYGLGVWAVVSEAALGLTGLKPAPWRVNIPKHVNEAAAHMVFGVVLDAISSRLARRL